MISLQFTGAWPSWLVISIAVVGAILIWTWYRRESSRMKNPWYWALPTLRCIAFLLMILMLLGPVLQYRWIEGELSRVAIIVDTSKSMSLTDGKDSASDTREQMVSSWLGIQPPKMNQEIRESITPAKGALDSLRQNHHVQLFDLEQNMIWDSESNRELPRVSELAANQPASPIGLAIQHWYRENLVAESPARGSESPTELVPPTTDGKQSGIDAIILLTDGQSTGNISPLTPILQSGKLKIPIYTIGVGSDLEPPDLAILKLEVSKGVREEDRLKGVAIIKEAIPAGTDYLFQITYQSKIVFEKKFQSAAEASRRIEFDFPVADVVRDAKAKGGDGLDRRAIAIELVGSVRTAIDEYSHENNSLVTSTWGMIKENEVLILDPRGRWETRYIRNALERDPMWKVSAWLGQSAFETDSYFPSTLDSLLDFELIILTTDTIALLDDEQASWLGDYVSNSGGGLIWIDSSRWEHGSISPIDDLIPIERLPNKELESEPSDRQTNIPMRLTSNGIAQPAFQLESDETANQQLWKELPGPHVPTHSQLKPGSESLVDVQWPDSANSTLIATRLYGQGRTIYVGTDETWRWRYNVADLYHQRFWNQLALWGMRAPFVIQGTYVALDAGKRVYGTGESIAIRARIRDENLAPWTKGKVQAIMKQGGQVIASLPLEETNDAPGFYHGTVLMDELPIPLGDSSQPKEISISLAAVGLSPQALDVETSFLATPEQEMELQQLACNSHLLQQIADESLGSYSKIETGQNIAALLEKHQRGKVVIAQTILWQSYPWFATIMILLAAEWYGRKRAGLI